MLKQLLLITFTEDNTQSLYNLVFYKVFLIIFKSLRGETLLNLYLIKFNSSPIQIQFNF